MFAGAPVEQIQKDQHNKLLNESGEMAPVCSGRSRQLNSEEAGIQRAHIELPREETVLQNGSHMVNGKLTFLYNC